MSEALTQFDTHWQTVCNRDHGIQTRAVPWTDIIGCHFADYMRLTESCVMAVICQAQQPRSQLHRHCVMLLTRTVLQMITQLAVGPRMLDFGKVSASSRNIRHLGVHNPLLQSIHVVLAVAQFPELKDTQPSSQVSS